MIGAIPHKPNKSNLRYVAKLPKLYAINLFLYKSIALLTCGPCPNTISAPASIATLAILYGLPLFSFKKYYFFFVICE